VNTGKADNTEVDRRLMEQKQKQEQVGLRYDEGKPRYDLIPPAFIKALALHFEAATKKYPDRNWEKGMSWCTIFRALISHAMEWFLGYKYDVDPTLKKGYKGHHMIAVAWNAMALFEYERRKIGFDDRVEEQFEREEGLPDDK
jgi:hypothetical protein